MSLKIVTSLLVLVACLFSCSPDEPGPQPVVFDSGEATDITATSAKITVNLSVAGNVTIDEKGICWSLNKNPSVTDSKTNEGSGSSKFTSQLTGLTRKTTYYARPYTKSDGTITYGNQISFQTLDGLSITLTTTPVTSITSNGAVSGGSITTSGTGTIALKGVCWSKSQNPTILDFKTSNGVGTSGYTSSLTNLDPGTTYYVRAYATDNSNQTTYGNQISFATQQGFVMTITTTSASSITSNGASSGGSITTTGTGTVAARGVCWNTTANPTIQNSKTTNGTGVGSFTSTITGLSANTLYYVRAYATDGIGNTTYGNEITLTTAAALSIEGLWKYSNSTNTLSIAGDVGTRVTFNPNNVDQAAINMGHGASINKPLINLVKTTSNTWKSSEFRISYQQNSSTGAITITNAAYIHNCTLTLSADGNSLTLSGVIPSGQGWPSSLVGQSFSTTWHRQ